MADIKDPENTLVIETTKGPVVIEMRPDLAPNHVAHIKKLAREGKYDGVVFHRVIDGFMAQTGDVKHGNADKGDVSPAERKSFVARCANQDWDAVIITQSSFERIPVSAATEEKFLAADRIIAGPPISMFSIRSSKLASGRSAVASKG